MRSIFYADAAAKIYLLLGRIVPAPLKGKSTQRRLRSTGDRESGARVDTAGRKAVATVRFIFERLSNEGARLPSKSPSEFLCLSCVRFLKPAHHARPGLEIDYCAPGTLVSLSRLWTDEHASKNSDGS